jgi:hypothetical protein
MWARTRALSLFWLGLLGLLGCSASGTVRGTAKVALSVKNCPEVTGLIAHQGLEWANDLGLDRGDAATLKAGLDASTDLVRYATKQDAALKEACSGLAADLGTPIAAATGEEACQQAADVAAQEKAKLGAQATVTSERVLGCKPGCADPCDAAAPAGPCAAPSVAVHVNGASDAQAAARYSSAFSRYLPPLLATFDAQSNARALLASSKAAIELGVVTGQAVSDGDLASAASAAICILPPLYAAKARLKALRDDWRVIARLANAAGTSIPKPEPEPPLAPHTTKGRGAPPYVIPAPYSERVSGLFVFPDGGFAAQTRRGISDFPSGQTLLDTSFREQNTSPGALYCDVGPGHRAVCLRSITVLNESGQQLAANLMLFDSQGGRSVVASVPGPKGSMYADGIGFDAAGELMFAYTQTEYVGDKVYTVTRLRKGLAQQDLPFNPELGSLEQLGGSGRVDPPIRFFQFRGRTELLYHQGRALLLTPLDYPGSAARIAELTSYDARPVEGGDGRLYVFYYEPKSRSARVAISGDGSAFRDVVLDSRESGWQIEAIPSADGAIAVYYYFRNTYNKGLRAVALHEGKLTRAPISIMREDRWNAGWHPYLVSDHGREVWLTYQSNVEAETRVWSSFASPQNLFDFAVEDNDTMEDNYKYWFVQAGAGVWYTFWNLSSKAPEAKELDGAVTLHDMKYHVEPALLMSANLEARFGPVDIGASYAQNYVDSAASKLDGSTGVLSGQVKIDDLLPGHDVKVEAVWGRYKGRASRDVDGADPETARVKTNYVDVRLLALNQWRIKYGLGFSRYAVPTPVQAYYAPKGQTHYTFAESALRDVSYNNLDLLLGYSKLDYLAKYENNYFGPIADITLAGGITLAAFDRIVTPAGKVSDDVALHLRGNLLLGWLWMNRFRALAGLGFYIRPSYAVEGSLTGSLSRPDDRKSDAVDSDDTKAKFELLSLRHGPWLDAGIVW